MSNLQNTNAAIGALFPGSTITTTQAQLIANGLLLDLGNQGGGGASEIVNTQNTVVVGVDGNDEPFVQGVETDGTTPHFKLAFDTHGNAEISGSTTLDVAARFTDDVITIGDVNDNQNSTKIVVDDANSKVEISGIVGIGGAAVAGVKLNVVGTVNNTGKINMGTTSIYTSSLLSIGFNTTTKDNGLVELGDWNGESNGTHIEIDDSSAMTIGFYATNGISANNAILPFANNAAAVAAIGTGKLYYTDVSGEYIVKMSH